MEYLQFKDVALTYERESAAVAALGSLDLSVGPGESLAIIGPSGCGKSSLLRMACGLLRPTSGEVLLEGAPLLAPRRDTALILQDFGLLPWATVGANAELGLKVRGVARAERRERAQEALALVGLADFAKAYPSELSGGMQQRLALARALALDVRLLLMDEPLSALDALLRERIQDLLRDLWRREGYAQVLVTHSIEEAVFLGQRIAIMSARPGRVVRTIRNPEAGQDGYRLAEAFHRRCDEVRELLAQEVAAQEDADALALAEGQRGKGAASSGERPGGGVR